VSEDEARGLDAGVKRTGRWEKAPPGLIVHRKEGQSYFVDLPEHVEAQWRVGEFGEVELWVRDKRP
jgi:hypothetical protein